MLVDEIEIARLGLQRQLDEGRAQAERNRLGQFATPTALATDILHCARSLLPPDEPVRFLDPALGTGSFYSALLRVFPSTHTADAEGFEIDPYYGKHAAELWHGTSLKLRMEDFTKADPPPTSRANLLICNPPYVRHHHLAAHEKERLQRRVQAELGIRVSGLTGLYCYFLLLSHQWMAENALAAWLIPSEFMDVNYGQAIKNYLLRRVNLIRIHRFDPNQAQFDDALVSSAVVWFRKAAPGGESVTFSYGGSLETPAISKPVPRTLLSSASKWTRLPRANEATNGQARIRLSDLFKIQRGIATGANSFFVLTEERAQQYEIPSAFLQPILPSPRLLQASEIRADASGVPILDRKLYLLNCDLPESEVKSRYPALWGYLQLGVETGISARYLCTHRSPWYAQEKRPAAPFVCTYMSRQRDGGGKLFRFILNRSNATAANVYLMLYPKPKLQRLLDKRPELVEQIWEALNRFEPDTLRDEGRVYGGGLHKLEPKELGNAPAGMILETLPDGAFSVPQQASLIFVGEQE